MYIQRDLGKRLRQAMKSFPAILITGPRQSGKTTFLKNEIREADYISFDDPMQRVFAREDPKGFLAQFSSHRIILDEIQYVPELFSYLKMEIDENRSQYGRWVMTGSQQFHLMKSVSDSLAGRIAIMNLYPFHSLENTLRPITIQDTIWLGGYPDNQLHPENRDLWLSSYIQTYLERDISQIIQVQDTLQFQTFLSLCAANLSQELNYSSLSREIGLSQPAIKKWVSMLVSSFIIYLVPPYFQNLGKRLIKSPKLYFIDQALAAMLTKHKEPESLFHGAMGGAFFESYIISETVKILHTKYGHSDIYFWRSYDGMEVDLLLSKEGKIWPIEIKKTATPMPRHTDSLIKFSQLMDPKQIGNPLLICTTKQSVQMPHNVTAIPWHEYLKWL